MSLTVAEPGAAPGSLIVEDTQIEWRGLLMGKGSFFGYKKLTGWEDLPSLASNSTPRPRSHGEFPGSLLMNDKIVTFETQMYGGPLHFAEQLRLLRSHTNVREEEDMLIVRQHGETLVVWARVTGRALPIDRSYFQGYPVATIQWTLSDPRRYGIEEKSVTVTPPVLDGGLDWDAGLDWDTGLDWGTLVSGSTPVAGNYGTADSPPVIEFVGPLTGPFTLFADQWSLGYNLTLNDGQILRVDTRTGLSMLDGADRLYALSASSDIPEDCILRPGETTLSLGTVDPSETGFARVTWRDAQD